MEGTQHMLVIVTTPSASCFAFTVHMLVSDCPVLPSFTGKQGATILSLPILALKFPQKISSLHESYDKKTGSHCKKVTTHTKLDELGIIIQEKGEQISFHNNRCEEWLGRWHNSTNSPLMGHFYSKLNRPSLYTMPKCTLNLNMWPRWNSVLSQVKTDISVVKKKKKKKDSTPWDQHFYFISHQVFILWLFFQCSTSHCFISEFLNVLL